MLKYDWNANHLLLKLAPFLLRKLVDALESAGQLPHSKDGGPWAPMVAL